MGRRRPGRPRKRGVERYESGRIKHTKPAEEYSGDYVDGVYVRRELSQAALRAAGLYLGWWRFKNWLFGLPDPLPPSHQLNLEIHLGRRAFSGPLERKPR